MVSREAKAEVLMKWRELHIEDCPECGNPTLEIYTEDVLPEKIVGLDGDHVRCPECGYKTGLTVDEEGKAWVQ